MNILEMFAQDKNWKFSTKETFTGINNFKNITILLLPKWSDKDLVLVESIHTKINKISDEVYVFDIDELLTLDVIENLFPGTFSITSTPVILEYRNGVLNKILQGDDIKT